MASYFSRYRSRYGIHRVPIKKTELPIKYGLCTKLQINVLCVNQLGNKLSHANGSVIDQNQINQVLIKAVANQLILFARQRHIYYTGI